MPKEQLVFGHSFSDHMLRVDWEEDIGWGAPRIQPFGPIELLPSSSVLNYSTSVLAFLLIFVDMSSVLRV
jgi:branched-chain amino acid aminotransferase